MKERLTERTDENATTMTAGVRGGRRRVGLSTYAALLAVGAYGGALGLATGFLELQDDLERRLPFGSPVFAAAALTILVAIPATVVMMLAWTGHRYAPHAAVLDGVLLVGWILVELAILRDFSFLHAVYLTIGAGLLFWGRSSVPELVDRTRGLWRRLS
jgi:hypothetical protein